jgi:hypothetical protein
MTYDRDKLVEVIEAMYRSSSGPYQPDGLEGLIGDPLTLPSRPSRFPKVSDDKNG